MSHRFLKFYSLLNKRERERTLERGREEIGNGKESKKIIEQERINLWSYEDTIICNRYNNIQSISNKIIFIFRDNYGSEYSLRKIF